ncbi:all-trans retinoic acid-induced differentiation factor isoform X2 [Anoplopoma fimbria]|uniref:all-trans retinoic acid-induced differentiation factor isoform X2 n=1 Tax=Anoplopoma fimbria TaxID=229290 RepID=UPI0023EB273E|nr:all-trans retinoic acid-induced differentiation factor isoform X2 [Anoplopoma fimbria]
MKAGCSQLKPVLLVLILNLCFYASYQLNELQVCELCSGAVLNGTAVGRFCSSSAGRIDGRCCLKNDNTSDPERIIGLDLSNCSLTHVEDLHGASTALMIDLSLNPIVNISDTAFQGFIELNYMILPQDIVCPGGNASWEKVEFKEGNRLCEGQRDMCNQTGQLSINCPENSICAPYGPSFFECSCEHNFHGYKCLREGEFPVLLVFGPLGVFMVVISFLLWVTQRRKVKSL